VVAVLHGPAPRFPAGGRLTGRWRYDRTAGRGIALSYERTLSGSAIRPRVRLPGGTAGRWRYDRTAGRGIALSYDRSTSNPPAPPPARERPEPKAPLPSHSPVIRVLCSCGELFSFESDACPCPNCGRLAEWPAMGVVEREMRMDLEGLLGAHGVDPDGG
jgi:hypothetical protein